MDSPVMLVSVTMKTRPDTGRLDAVMLRPHTRSALAMGDRVSSWTGRRARVMSEVVVGYDGK